MFDHQGQAKQNSSAPPRRHKGHSINVKMHQKNGIFSPQNRAIGNHLLQTKTSSKTTGDLQEREADQIAETVMASPNTNLSSNHRASDCVPNKLPTVQRKTIGSHSAPNNFPDISAGVQNLEGSGTPLSASDRHFFEPRFDTDFSGVRLHTNTQAHRLADTINARAFTYGQQVVFSAGEYSPETTRGRALLAHELTHVVQQRNGHRQISRQVAAIDSMSFQPLTPSEMFEIVLRERAWTFNPGGAPLEPTNPHGRGVGPDATVLPQGYTQGVQGGSRPRLARSSVFTVMQITDASGNLVDITSGEYVNFAGRGDPHAEQRALRAMEDQNQSRFGRAPRGSFRGGTLTVVVDQMPCPPSSANCFGRLRQFANDHGLGLEVLVPTRGRASDRNRTNPRPVAPRTAAMSAQRADLAQHPVTRVRLEPVPGLSIPPPSGGGSTPGAAGHSPPAGQGPTGGGGTTGSTGSANTTSARQRLRSGNLEANQPTEGATRQGRRRLQLDVSPEQTPGSTGNRGRNINRSSGLSSPPSPTRTMVRGMVLNLGAAVVLGIMQEGFRRQITDELNNLEEPANLRSAMQILSDPASHSSIRVTQLLGRHLNPFRRQLESHHSNVIFGANIETVLIAVSGMGTEDRFNQIDSLLDEMIAYEDQLLVIEDNLTAILSTEDSTREASDAARALEGYASRAIVADYLVGDLGLTIEQYFELRLGLISYANRILRIMRDSRSIRTQVRQMRAEIQQFIDQLRAIWWGEFGSELERLIAEAERRQSRRQAREANSGGGRVAEQASPIGGLHSIVMGNSDTPPSEQSQLLIYSAQIVRRIHEIEQSLDNANPEQVQSLQLEREQLIAELNRIQERIAAPRSVQPGWPRPGP